MVSIRTIKQKKRLRLDTQLTVPSDERIAELSTILAKQIHQEEIHRRYAPVKHILAFLGLAGVVGLSFISPSAAILAKPFLDEERRKKYEVWKQYNPSYLRSAIKRFHKQKYVEIKGQNGEEVVVLSEAGKRRILKYALDELSIEKPRQWDGRWRLIVYDVENRKKRLRDVFREALRALGFCKLQESVWLYPYPCEKQVTFLKEYYGVGNEVLYIVATTLEDDSPYRDYFGIA
ncbi:hypothetical protein KKB64_00415 [Patescibacteria group bacterium]|nr:hypothetical protein [Patescibacteria group bacterium]MBU1472237.1 hypothetical protein [Patescibacteria group bacterium]MBU2460512.1 hypothetical protein [Patescibacteria group bacterium]MBU2544753.1 hypothetical protein [Patescibacteria group bacterium]